jgi:hypothetical protein
VQDDVYQIPFLRYGEYLISVEDSAGASIAMAVTRLDDEVPVITCDVPMDIVILNDVSGSVSANEYSGSKQFFTDFLRLSNIGTASDQSRAAIVEWSFRSEQAVRIPMTGELADIEAYLDSNRAFAGGTAPHEALAFGEAYLRSIARPDVERVLVLCTDGSRGQVSSSDS